MDVEGSAPAIPKRQELPPNKKVISISIPKKDLEFKVTQRESGEGLPYGVKDAFQSPVGEEGASVIGSHNTEFPGRIFKNLEIGDLLHVTMSDGTKQIYKISGTRLYKYTNQNDPYSGQLTFDGHTMGWDDQIASLSKETDRLLLYASLGFQKYSPQRKEFYNAQVSAGLRFLVASKLSPDEFMPKPRSRREFE